MPRPVTSHAVSSRRGFVAILSLVALASGVRGAGARVHDAPDLPPADRDALARMFDPDVSPLGLRITRAALRDPYNYDRSPTGTHLAVYVAPIVHGEVGGAVYVRNIMKVARVFLPSVFRRWSDLKSFDVCQEPEPLDSSISTPPLTSQLIATRNGATKVGWKHASLATLLERADAIDGKNGGTDPLSLSVSSRTISEPLFRDALTRAGLPVPETTTVPPA